MKCFPRKPKWASSSAKSYVSEMWMKKASWINRRISLLRISSILQSMPKSPSNTKSSTNTCNRMWNKFISKLEWPSHINIRNCWEWLLLNWILRRTKKQWKNKLTPKSSINVSISRLAIWLSTTRTKRLRNIPNCGPIT